MALEVHIEKQLRDFSLDVAFAAGDSPVGILGPSGAGKTMLLRCIAGLERPDRGRVALGGRVLFDGSQRVDLPARSRRVGMLFQNYALFPHRTVAENVAFGLRDLPAGEKEKRVSTMLERTHVTEFGQRFPLELSGGEQQRVALARALSTKPEALLLDEPLSALDTHLRSQVEALLQDTFAAYRRPALLVTHNMEEAYRLGEKLLVLSRGRVSAFGEKEAIFRRPPTLEVARLTGCKNFSRARMVSNNVVEALDWGCQLRVLHTIERPVEYIGIRAHHLGLAEPSNAASDENILRCELVRSSETPFRITLYLRLLRPVDKSGEQKNLSELQAEVSKEKWQTFRGHPMPWHVQLSPDSLFLLPE